MAFLGLAVFLFIQFYQQEKEIGSTNSGKGGDVSEEHFSFIKCLEAFQNDLNISLNLIQIVL